MDIEKQLKIYTNQLRLYFRFAYSGKLSLGKLYSKGKELSDKLNDLRTPLHEDVAEAIGFIEQLHDEETKSYNENNKEKIYYYFERLKKLI
ncbi:MAG: hypothetical protein KKF67_02375 [Nanoarchaeota archaeon]|nr:hypothetical protein [Nanoarchaeota archaeon]